MPGPYSFKFKGSSKPLLRRHVLQATATLDFPSVAAAGSQTLTVNVPEAAVGDAVSIGFLAAPPAGVIFTGWVSAAGVVTVRAQNVTAAAVDPASASYTVLVVKAAA